MRVCTYVSTSVSGLTGARVRSQLRRNSRIEPVDFHIFFLPYILNRSELCETLLLLSVSIVSTRRMTVFQF